jgi:hypothetical protein
MGRFGLVATGTDSWTLLRRSQGESALQDSAHLGSANEHAVASLRKTSVHPELWFFQSIGDPHMVPIIAEDYYIACKKYLLQIEEREIAREDLIVIK